MLLMGSVVALLALLTVLLSGLSSGLVNDGVSGLKTLPVAGFAFEATQAQLDAVTLDVASAIALQTDDGQSFEKAGVDVARADAAAGTTTSTLTKSFDASPGYSAETLTLQMIQVFLYAICAMVIGAFFTVWTIQRTHELSVLRALGAPTTFLIRDALVQAAVLLVGATAVGVGVGVALGSLMPEGMPFDLEAPPLLVASALTISLGLAGAVVAVLRITSIDPLQALGGQR